MCWIVPRTRLVFRVVMRDEGSATPLASTFTNNLRLISRNRGSIFPEEISLIILIGILPSNGLVVNPSAPNSWKV